MKTIFSVIIAGLITIPGVTAQNNAEQPIKAETFTSTNIQKGNTNYQLSLSEHDFSNNSFVFYTDSNASVAYMKINGVNLRLKGGPNPEHILAYTCPGYTVTLSFDASKPKTIVKNADDWISVKTEATLVIYNDKAKQVAKKVTGVQLNAIKN